jgi:hypothetical protein
LIGMPVFVMFIESFRGEAVGELRLPPQGRSRVIGDERQRVDNPIFRPA